MKDGKGLIPSWRGFLHGAIIVILVLVVLKMFPVIDVTRFVPTFGGTKPAAS